MQGHCMKCGMKKDLVDAEIGRTKRGGLMAKGKCDKNHTVCAFMSLENADKAVAAGEAKKAY